MMAAATRASACATVGPAGSPSAVSKSYWCRGVERRLPQYRLAAFLGRPLAPLRSPTKGRTTRRLLPTEITTEDICGIVGDAINQARQWIFFKCLGPGHRARLYDVYDLKQYNSASLFTLLIKWLEIRPNFWQIIVSSESRTQMMEEGAWERSKVGYFW